MSLLKEGLLEWSNEKLKGSGKPEMFEIKALRQEASTREYFRLKGNGNSLIGVFSPPETELNEQFIFLSNYFRNNAVTVPEVFYFDLESGWMLVEDFGDDSYQFKLNKNNFHHLFSAAIDEMINIQLCQKDANIPVLEERDLRNQMLLFEDWFLKDLLGMQIGREETDLFSDLYKVVIQDLKEQPKVLCHFDFESRNLVILEDGNAGVLDFQDAVYGPIFLDPSALFKDLYLKIKDEELNALLEEYLSRSNELGLKQVRTIKNPRKSFDLTGLQRQLRILGTLSRLHLRDGKSFRLSDLPKTLNFVMDTSMKYQELNEVSNYLKERVAPLLTQKLKENL